MARIPGVRWRPIPENQTQPHIRPTQWIVHTFVDARTANIESMANYFESAANTLESHTILGWRDHVQLISTDRSADANYKANRRPDGSGAISTETEDDGAPIENPWNDYQIRELIRTGFELNRMHGIPARLCPDPSAPGMGWHAMFGAPSDWTPFRGKICPGPTRIAQFKNVVLPGIKRMIAGNPAPTGDSPVAETLYHLWQAPDGKVWAVANDTQSKRHVPDAGVLELDLFFTGYATRAAGVTIVKAGSATERWLKSIPVG